MKYVSDCAVAAGGGNLQLYEKTFETLFTYTVESNVSTFAGRTGVTGQHYFGPLLTSCLYAPSLLISDNEDNFYLAEWSRGERRNLLDAQDVRSRRPQ